MKEMFERDYESLRVQKRINAHASQLADIAAQPKFSMGFVRAKLGYRNFYSTDIGQINFTYFHQVKDNNLKTTGDIYAIQYVPSDATEVGIYRSFDGAKTWTKIGVIAVSAGERINGIFVEPYNGYVVIFRYATPHNKVEVYTQGSGTLIRIGTPVDMGVNVWHESKNNIDCHNNSGRYCMFAEYGSSGSALFRVWKTTDFYNWTVVFQQTGNNGVDGAGEVRHFHCLQVDPFTKYWYLGSGDNNAQCKIWRSIDHGANWELLWGGTQYERTLGFVFEQDYIYYVNDSPTAAAPSRIYRIKKSDMSREVIGTTRDGLAAYGITKTYFPRGFLIFPQREPSSVQSDHIAVQWYDTAKNKLYDVAKLSTEGILASAYTGFFGASQCQDMYTGAIMILAQDNLVLTKYAEGPSAGLTATSVMCGHLTM